MYKVADWAYLHCIFTSTPTCRCCGELSNLDSRYPMTHTLPTLGPKYMTVFYLSLHWPLAVSALVVMGFIYFCGSFLYSFKLPSIRSW